MPGIDFSMVRSLVGMGRVLQLIEFAAVETAGDELRGPCPVHRSTSASSRSFSANIRKNTFRCFSCGAQGNQLDLWVATSKRPLYDATRELCEKAGVDVPVVRPK